MKEKLKEIKRPINKVRCERCGQLAACYNDVLYHRCETTNKFCESNAIIHDALTVYALVARQIVDRFTRYGAFKSSGNDPHYEIYWTELEKKIHDLLESGGTNEK